VCLINIELVLERKAPKAHQPWIPRHFQGLYLRYKYRPPEKLGLKT
jgi:hypothetical protein